MTDLLALTRKETDLVVRFIDLLKNEQEILQRGDAGALPPLVAEKTKLAEELNGLSRQRNQFLAQWGLEGNKAGMSAWLGQNPGATPIAKAWAGLLKLAEQARVLHQQNSELVTLHLQSTNAALAALNQQMQKSLLYGPDGQSAPLPGKRIIASA